MGNKSEIFREEARTLIHNVRGSVGIINSSLELISVEDQSESATRMISMINRQVVKILAELELFTECYAPRESAIGESSSLYKAITYASDILGIPVEIRCDLPNPQGVKVTAPEVVLRTIFTSLLIKPSPIEENYVLNLKAQDQELICAFEWPEEMELSQRFIWIGELLPRYGASFKIKKGRGRLAFKVQ